MIESIKNIIPRLKNFSVQLNIAETFVDKSWLYYDNDGNNHEYIFMRDHRLIMSLNGTAITGKWEILPNGNLLIDRLEDVIILKYEFVDNALMILQKNRSNEDPFILINEKIIPDFNVLKYLEDYEEKRIHEEKPLIPGSVQILPSGKVRFNNVACGYSAYSLDGSITSGLFSLEPKLPNRVMEVKNGIVTNLFYVQSYLDDKKQILKIYQPYIYLSSGSLLGNLNELNIELSKIIRIKRVSTSKIYNIKIDASGEISVTDDISIVFPWVIISLILAVMFFLYYYKIH